MWRSILLVAMCVPALAVIVDRIAITVGVKVITDSEINLRIRLTAFENGAPPDFGIASRKAAADRLVDQKLVEREMDVGHYPHLTGETPALLLANYTQTNFRSDAVALDRMLNTYGVTAADLENDLARQSDLLSFLNLRFRPSVQVSDQDVRQYFDREIKPKEPAEVMFNDFRTQIEQRITSQRADMEMETWLRDQRKRARIEYLEKDLAP